MALINEWIRGSLKIEGFSIYSNEPECIFQRETIKYLKEHARHSQCNFIDYEDVYTFTFENKEEYNKFVSYIRDKSMSKDFRNNLFVIVARNEGRYDDLSHWKDYCLRGRKERVYSTAKHTYEYGVPSSEFLEGYCGRVV